MTTTDNKLIAEFMGVEKENGLYLFTTPMDDYKTDALYFDTSWDWLMPVVQKIDATTTLSSTEEPYLYCFDLLNGSKTKENTITVVDGFNGDTIVSVPNKSGTYCKEATYTAVVEFIKFLNNKN